jgi:hypothetical protein
MEGKPLQVNIGGKYFNTDDEKFCSVKECRKNLENEPTYSYATIGIKINANELQEGETHYVHLCQNCYQNLVEKHLTKHVIDSYFTEVAVAYSDEPEVVFKNIEEKEKQRYSSSFLEKIKQIILHKSAKK